MQALLAHLDLVARRDFSALRRLCGVDDADLADMIAEIRRLNPKPGLAFGSAVVQPIVPDVFVRVSPEGGWLVELNSDTLPKVLVNQSYYATVSKTAKNDGEKSYLAECLQTATWLMRALDQRAKTILKVSTEIVRQQDAFFAHGVQFLRPLNLKTVADAISMHKSTVSRVTANKYMATSRGIFELKYFFTSSIAASDGGEAHSAEAVRHRIRQLIDAESASDVLSDDTIVDRLREAGIDIARRTVRKIPGGDADTVIGSAPARKAGTRRTGTRATCDGGRLTSTQLCRPTPLALLLVVDEGYPAVGSQRPGPVNGGRSCRFASREKISTSAEPCASGSAHASLNRSASISMAAYSGHVTVEKDGFGFRTECAIRLNSGITLHTEANAADAYVSARSGGAAHREAAAPLQAAAQGSPRRAGERRGRGAVRHRCGELCARSAGARRARTR